MPRFLSRRDEFYGVESRLETLGPARRWPKFSFNYPRLAKWPKIPRPRLQTVHLRATYLIAGYSRWEAFREPGEKQEVTRGGEWKRRRRKSRTSNVFSWSEDHRLGRFFSPLPRGCNSQVFEPPLEIKFC